VIVSLNGKPVSELDLADTFDADRRANHIAKREEATAAAAAAAAAVAEAAAAAVEAELAAAENSSSDESAGSSGDFAIRAEAEAISAIPAVPAVPAVPASAPPQAEAAAVPTVKRCVFGVRRATTARFVRRVELSLPERRLGEQAGHAAWRHRARLETSAAERTTCGLSAQAVRLATFYSCGHAFTMVTKPEERATFGGGSMGAAAGGFGGSCSGMRAEQVSFSLQTGERCATSSQLTDLDETVFSKGKQPSEAVAVCYNADANLFWTVSADAVDEWAASAPPAPQAGPLATRVAAMALTAPEVSLADTMAVMHHFLQTQGGKLIPAAMAPAKVEAFLQQAIELLSTGAARGDRAAVGAAVQLVTSFLRKRAAAATLPPPIAGPQAAELRRLLWSQLEPVTTTAAAVATTATATATATATDGDGDGGDEGVGRLAGGAVLAGVAELYPTAVEQLALVRRLCTGPAPLFWLRDKLVAQIASNLAGAGAVRSVFFLGKDDHAQPAPEFVELTRLLLGEAVAVGHTTFGNVAAAAAAAAAERGGERSHGRHAVAHPIVCALGAMQRRLLAAALGYKRKKPTGKKGKAKQRGIGASKTAKQKKQPSRSPSPLAVVGVDEPVVATKQELLIASVLRPYLLLVLAEIGRLVRSASGVVAAALAAAAAAAAAGAAGDAAGALSAGASAADDAAAVAAERKKQLRQRFTAAAKNSVIGYLVPSLVHVQASEKFAKVADGDGDEPSAALLSALVQFTAEVDVFNSQLVDPHKTEHTIPDPHASGSVIESVHPLRDHYRFSETRTLEGAKSLFLTFDSRSCSQYDYDKLVISAGDSADAAAWRCEFGGNPHNFGSRSTIGSGWPTKPVKVPGDTVTVTMDVRSTRESQTPDFAMWGFAIKVVPFHGGHGFPFTLDLALSSAAWCFKLVRALYNGKGRRGAAATAEAGLEAACDALLSPTLYGCTWRPDSAGGGPTAAGGLPPPALLELRGRAVPSPRPLILRPSFKNDIALETLEGLYVAAALRFLPGPPGAAAEGRDPAALSAIFSKFSRLVRTLTQYAEIERKWRDSATAAATGNAANAATADTAAEEPLFFAQWAVDDGDNANSLNMLCHVVGVRNVDATASVQALTEALAAAAAMAAATAAPTVAAAVEGAEAGAAATASDAAAAAGTGTTAAAGASPAAAPRRTPQFAAAIAERCKLLLEASAPAPAVTNSAAVPAEAAAATTEAVLADLNLFLTSRVFDQTEMSPSPAQFRAAIVGRRERAAGRVAGLLEMAKLLQGQPQPQPQPQPQGEGEGEGGTGGGGNNCGFESVALQQFFAEATTSMLREVPVDEGLACCGIVDELHAAFALTLRGVVESVRRNPKACLYGLGICLIPFGPTHATSISESQVVSLLKGLCTGAHGRDVTGPSLAAFRVLALRCARWEEESTGRTGATAAVALEDLSKQIAAFLSTHLMEAVERCSAAAATDPTALSTTGMYNLLDLLDNLVGAVSVEPIVFRRPIVLSSLPLSLRMARVRLPLVGHVAATWLRF
jgi:hypothetical protein